MALPVFFPTADVSLTLPPGEPLSVRELCRQAGVSCRVTGAPAERPVRLAASPAPRAIRRPGPLGEVWLGVPSGPPAARALKALGLLAYGALDYCARESLRGLVAAKPGPGPGRPPSGSAMTPAERQRRYRKRLSSRRASRRA